MQTDQPQGIDEERRAIRHLLSPIDPADALASYYALWHDPRRTSLTVHYGPAGSATGFAAVCQTGADLFRPLVTLRAPDTVALGSLLHEALVPQRPYQAVAPLALAHGLREHLAVSEASTHAILELKPGGFQPVINVLVQRATGPDASVRFQIESQGRVVAVAGTNWRSPSFAEVFVLVHPSGRRRGWGRSVVSACVADLLRQQLRPLYVTPEDHEASMGVALSLGFSDTGRRQVSASVHL